MLSGHDRRWAIPHDSLISGSCVDVALGRRNPAASYALTASADASRARGFDRVAHPWVPS
jgi:hypothetical protein